MCVYVCVQVYINILQRSQIFNFYADFIVNCKFQTRTCTYSHRFVTFIMKVSNCEGQLFVQRTNIYTYNVYFQNYSNLSLLTLIFHFSYIVNDFKQEVRLKDVGYISSVATNWTKRSNRFDALRVKTTSDVQYADDELIVFLVARSWTKKSKCFGRYIVHIPTTSGDVRYNHFHLF